LYHLAFVFWTIPLVQEGKAPTVLAMSGRGRAAEGAATASDRIVLGANGGLARNTTRVFL
jgi:hypothetical protein